MDVNPDGMAFCRSNFELVIKELKRLRAQNENYRLLEQMRSTKGFIVLFFEELPNSRNQVEAFNKLNDQFFELTGEFRYSSYDSFKIVKNKYLRSND